jgi:uncharacterized membrane protein
VGDLFMGIPASVSDRAITEGWADNSALYVTEKLNAQLWSLLYTIATLILLTATLISFKQKSKLTFYSTFLFGLTLFQTIPVTGLIKHKANTPSFVVNLAIIIFIILMAGQVLSVLKIVTLLKIRKQQRAKQS